MPHSRDRRNSSTEWALRERVKELACLYGMAKLLGDPQKTIDQRLAGTAALLPPAWQFPEHAAARITLDGAEHPSGAFDRARHVQSAEVVVEGERRGVVEVGYTSSDLPEAAEGPFLQEERHLIENVAGQLAAHVRRCEVEAHRKELEAQLRHADRLATIGQLAAGVAHEMNEPLGNILGFAQLALKGPDVPPQLGADLQKIVDAALRGREIVKQLLLFARQTSPRKSRCDLNRVVEQAVALLEAGGERRGIAFARNLADGLPEVEADAVQLNQVAVNLLVNAMHAVSGSGRIEIETRADLDGIELVIADSGCGMTPDVLEQIFNPFYTTKEVGEGTGLGLSVVHGIVNAHGGSIHAESTPGRGSRFVVRLPHVAGGSTEPRSDAGGDAA